jgi:hypothetical protein
MSAIMLLADSNGRETRNEISFSGCREYGSESVIRFGPPDEPPAAPAPKKK